MGLFGKAKNKAAELAGDNKDKVEDGIDKAGDAADEKTGGKFDDQVDSAQDAAKDKLDDI